jgi:hypothetical protein
MDLIRRIRWPNVARAAALVAAVLLVIAWPKLRADPPPLPPEPAIEGEARAAAPDEFGLEREPAAPAPAPAAAEREARAKRRGAVGRVRAKRHRRTRRHRRAEPRRVRGARPAPVVAPPSAAPRWTPPPPSPRSEFGFEDR